LPKQHRFDAVKFRLQVGYAPELSIHFPLLAPHLVTLLVQLTPLFLKLRLECLPAHLLPRSMSSTISGGRQRRCSIAHMSRAADTRQRFGECSARDSVSTTQDLAVTGF